MELQELKERIENMGHFHQVEILRIFNNSLDAKLSENANGVFVNLTSLSQETLQQIHNYVQYVEEQTETLNEMEKEKQRLETTFFSEKDKRIQHKENQSKGKQAKGKQAKGKQDKEEQDKGKQDKGKQDKGKQDKEINATQL